MDGRLAYSRDEGDEIMNKVTALSVLSNAVLTRSDSPKSPGSASRKAVARDDLARISPLASAHVIPSGTYRFPKSAPALE